MLVTQGLVQRYTGYIEMPRSFTLCHIRIQQQRFRFVDMIRQNLPRPTVPGATRPGRLEARACALPDELPLKTRQAAKT